jgi:arylformamidase
MPVHSSYDPAWLNSQYNNRLHVPDFQDYFDRWEKESRETENALPVIKDIAYGDGPRERLDVYPSPHPRSKTLIFIHGGYWQMLDKTLFHFLARGFHAKGITTVFLTYPLAPAASIDDIVGSCRKTVPWLYHNASTFNSDPNQLYVAGHSAGGHLAAMLVATDWGLLHPDIPANVLKGACFVSGLFDLVPIQLSYLNAVLGMDKEMAVRNSPVKFQSFAACPLIIAVGERETEAFHEQSRELYKSWKEKVNEVQFLSLPWRNHFSVVDAVTDPDATLFPAICRLMGR